MGTRSRQSDRFKLDRLQIPEEERRETLNPCDACGGHGYRIERATEFDGSRYRYRELKVSCKWCKGTGSVTSALARAFARWKRILRHNRAAGTCRDEGA